MAVHVAARWRNILSFCNVSFKCGTFVFLRFNSVQDIVLPKRASMSLAMLNKTVDQMSFKYVISAVIDHLLTWKANFVFLILQITSCG